MPIYDYRCEDGHTVEVMHGINDEPITKCEVCGAPVQRVFHPIAVHFKGKGFYNTDYGTRRRQRETLAAAEGSKDKDSSSSSSSESSSNGSGPSEGKKDAKNDRSAAKAKAAPKSS
jgi:putative FmdB family regulatory protein